MDVNGNNTKMCMEVIKVSFRIVIIWGEERGQLRALVVSLYLTFKKSKKVDFSCYFLYV